MKTQLVKKVVVRPERQGEVLLSSGRVYVRWNAPKKKYQAYLENPANISVMEYLNG